MSNNIVLFKNKEDCCGCSACYNICPKGAIKMVPDELGFLYPEIDNEKCIKCGLCQKVCSFNKNYDKALNITPTVYGARHKEISEINKSRSGATFVALTDYILENDGIVYGAGYKDHFVVVHKRATNKQERDEFRGSKYVQSDLSNIFKLVKKDLLDGKNVLFSGTPCQTSGLNSFVDKTLRDNLYLVDIVCHGVPAPFIWRDYLKYSEQQQGEKICDVNFRDKSDVGWAKHIESLTYSSGKQYVKKYSCLFSSCIMFRKSCGICHFANTVRPSDITIGDFWGWQKTDKSFNKDDKGVSLVLCNTEKGKFLFECARKDMNIIETSLDMCLQPNLQSPTVINPKRQEFEEDYIKFGFEYVLNKYTKLPLKRMVKNWIKQFRFVNYFWQIYKKFG